MIRFTSVLLAAAVLFAVVLAPRETPTAEALELPPAAAGLIQAALDVGGEVRLGSGDYSISTGLTVTGSNVRLVGAGLSTRIICDCIGSHVLRVTGSGVEVSNLALGHLNPVTRDAKYGLFVDGGDRANVHDVEVFAATGAGILLNSSDDSTVSRAYVHNTLADGIHVTGASNRVTVSDSHLTDTGDDALASVGYRTAGAPNADIAFLGNTVTRSKAHGIRLEGTDHGIASGNTISLTKAGGIAVSQSSSYSTYGSSNVSVTGNTITGANTYDTPTAVHAGIGVYSWSATYPTINVVVDGNTVTGSKNQSIAIGVPSGSVSTFNVAVSNNVVVANLARPSISVEKTDSVSVTGNLSQDAAGHGISISGNVTGSVVINANIINEPAHLQQPSHGVIVVGAGPRAVITSNSVRDLDCNMGNNFYLTTLVTYIFQDNLHWTACP